MISPVHPGVIGRRIGVTADLDRVQVFCDGERVADHKRVWAWHQTITDPAHREAANMPRHNRIGALCPVREREDQLMVEQRRLSDYDAALGIDLGEGAVLQKPVTTSLRWTSCIRSCARWRSTKTVGSCAISSSSMVSSTRCSLRCRGPRPSHAASTSGRASRPPSMSWLSQDRRHLRRRRTDRRTEIPRR